MLPLAIGREASTGVEAPTHMRRRPERTLLYQIVEEYYPALKEHLAAPGTVLPGYAKRPDGSLGLRWVKAPASAELALRTQTLALRVGRYLERQGWLARDVESSYPFGEEVEAGPLAQPLGSWITYRVAVGPHQGRKVFTLLTLPACDDGVGKGAGFSLHAGVAARAGERKKLEQLCRYI